MNHTDKITALRDALQFFIDRCDSGMAVSKTTYAKFKEVLALTADASEDAPDVVRHVKLIGGGYLKREDREGGSHGWLVYGDDDRLLFALKRPDQCFVDSALAARPAPSMSDLIATHQVPKAKAMADLCARPAPVAATLAPDLWALIDAYADHRAEYEHSTARHLAKTQRENVEHAKAELASALASIAAAPAAPIAAPFAYVTSDKRMLIFADNTDGIADDPSTLTPLYDHPAPIAEESTRERLELEQRKRMAKRFENRPRTPATADFDLPAPNDATEAPIAEEAAHDWAERGYVVGATVEKDAGKPWASRAVIHHVHPNGALDVWSEGVPYGWSARFCKPVAS